MALHDDGSRRVNPHDHDHKNDWWKWVLPLALALLALCLFLFAGDNDRNATPDSVDQGTTSEQVEDGDNPSDND